MTLFQFMSRWTTMTTILQTSTENKDRRTGSVTSRYSMVNNSLYLTGNGNSKEPQCKHMEPGAIECSKSQAESRLKDKTNKKLFTCLFIWMVLLSCVVCVCVSVTFTEIYRVKSASATSTSSFQQLIQRLNESFFSLTTIAVLGQSQILPAPSCAGILFINSSSSSGYYWVTSSNGSAVRVYCDMTRSCGGITGGWTRVASLDMRDNSTQCPSGLRENSFGGTIRTCVNRNSSGSCSSDTFPTYNLPYSNICGQIRAYQFGSTDAFFGSFQDRTIVPSIEDNYVDGVSLTHGNPKKHLLQL